MTQELLRQYDFVDEQAKRAEKRIARLLKVTPAMQRLMTLPGVGQTLSVAIALERGDVKRFATAEHLASYSGTTPRVHSSGDKTRYGHLRQDVNRYLKWAFIEAANGVCLNRRYYPYRHVSRLYEGSRAARKPGRTELRTARLGVRRPHSRNSSRLLPSGRRSSPVRKTEDGRRNRKNS